jgi:hypothetical protein
VFSQAQGTSMQPVFNKGSTCYVTASCGQLIWFVPFASKYQVLCTIPVPAIKSQPFLFLFCSDLAPLVGRGPDHSNTARHPCAKILFIAFRAQVQFSVFWKFLQMF